MSERARSQAQEKIGCRRYDLVKPPPREQLARKLPVDRRKGRDGPAHVSVRSLEGGAARLLDELIVGTLAQVRGTLLRRRSPCLLRLGAAEVIRPALGQRHLAADEAARRRDFR